MQEKCKVFFPYFPSLLLFQQKNMSNYVIVKYSGDDEARTVRINDGDLVYDLFKRACGIWNLMTNSYVLSHKGVVCKTSKTLEHYNITANSMLLLLPAPRELAQDHQFWDFNLDGSLTSHPDHLIRDPKPTIAVSLKNIEHLSFETTNYVFPQNFQNDWSDHIMFSDFWSEEIYSASKILVLRLRSEFQFPFELPLVDQLLKKTLYDQRTNESLYDPPSTGSNVFGGDLKSWQRYSQDKPLAISGVSISGAELRFSIEEPLTDQTCYTILFRNGPRGFDERWTRMNDYAITFRTCFQEQSSLKTEKKVCAVCLDHTPEMLCVPCGHKALCVQCAERTMMHGKRCPICRSRASKFIKVFDI